MDLTHADWRKASYSGNAGNCVEVAGNIPGIVAMRDSKNPEEPPLTFTAAQWRTFAAAVRIADFDLA